MGVVNPRHTMNWWKTFVGLYLIFGLTYVATAGFLEDELPLEIVTTTPSTLRQGKTTTVRDKQTITVVFSRPVIALGADFGEEELPDDLVPFTLEPTVQGKLRWVTTYIARFDSDDDLPYDSEIQLKWNLKLTTYDGVRLTAPAKTQVTLRTPSNSMRIRKIVSETANVLTDNNWDFDTGLRADILPEQVKDGVIELAFQVPVDLKVLHEDLRIREIIPAGEDCKRKSNTSLRNCEPVKQDTNLFANVKPCVPGLRLRDSEESTCANLTIIAGKIKENTQYELFLKEGIVYSSKQGPLKEEMVVSFGGLRPFKLPFRDGPPKAVDSKYLDIWLPHGTGVEQTIHDIPINITDQITQEQVSFIREEISESVFRLTADIRPGGKYRIETFDSTVARDGYGQELIGTSLNFTTTDVGSRFRIMRARSLQSFALFEKGQNWSSQIVMFTKGNGKNQCKTADIWSVVKVPDLVHISANERYFQTRFDEILGDQSITISPPFEDPSGEVVTVPVSEYLKDSGVVALQKCRTENRKSTIYQDRSDDRLIVMESEYNAVAYLYHEYGRQTKVLVYVSELSTGNPVADVTAHWYTNRERSYSRPDRPRKVASNSTNKTGVATFQINRWINQSVIEIDDNGKLLHVPVIRQSGPIVTSTRDALILDRKMIRPGEQLFVKGFVIQRQESVMQYPEGVVFVLDIYPSLTGVGESTRIPLDISREFGSYNASIEIPQNVSLRKYTIHLEAEDTIPSFSGQWESFTVGEPRSPTVEMTVNGSEWVLPTGIVTIDIEASSFIGASVGDQEITISWTASKTSNNNDNDEIEGENTVITNAEGKANFELNLASVDGVLSVGDNLDFTVKWVGPTGELIEESFSTDIAYEDLEIEISRTVETDLPNQNFGVSIELKNLNGVKKSPGYLSIESAEITLKEINDSKLVPTDDYGPLPLAPAQKCTFSFEKSEMCEFQLPSVGLFALEACVETPTRTLCGWKTLGSTQQSWTASPLADFIPVGFQKQGNQNGGDFKPGDTFEIVVDNPYKNARAFMVWGNMKGTEYKVQELPDAQRSTLSFEVEEKCRFECSYSITVVIPRQTSGLATTVDIPVSRLFDPAMPHTHSYETSIRSDRSEEEMEVQIDFPKASEDGNEVVISPGETTEISISVDTDDPTEITVIAVDKSILELVSNPLVSLIDALAFTSVSKLRNSASTEYIIAPKAIQELIERFEFEKELDPWFDINNELVKEPRSDIDLDRQQYIEQNSDYITVYPSNTDFPPYGEYDYGSYYGPILTKESTFVANTAENSLPLARSANFDGSADQGVVSLRSDTAFQANALFAMQVIEGGKGSFNFTAPDNLGTFVIRAYTASGTGIFGRKESEIIVRRTLSLTPSTPRFVRVQDLFEAGAVITSSSTIKNPVVFEVEFTGPVELIGRSRQRVRLGADLQEEAQFQFIALALGTAIFRFSVEDKDGNKDAVEVRLSIEGLQEEVVIGTSFVLQSTLENSTSSEGLDLPKAVPGSGTVAISAGVGQQPALIALTQQTQEADPEFKCPYDYESVLVAAFTPAVLNPYSLWSEISNNNNNLKEILEEALTRFDKAVDLLSIGEDSMTQRNLGLISYLHCPKDRLSSLPTDPSIFVNGRALWLFNQLESDLENHDEDTVKDGYETLVASKQIWTRVLEKAVVNEARRSRSKFNSSISISVVALSHAVFGSQWIPSGNTGKQILQDLSTERLSSEFTNMSHVDQAYYILSLLQDSEDEDFASEEYTRAVEEWTSLYRVTGRTAYIAESEGASRPASNLANALILLALVRIGTEDQMLPKLAAYVGAPIGDYYGFTRFTDYDKIVAMAALMSYDVSRNNIEPDVTLSTQSGSVTIFQTTFNESSVPIVAKRLDWEQLGDNPDSLQFTAMGTGEVSVALTLTFIPLELLTFPSYRGIFVERVITLEENGGQGVSVVPVGSTVFVKVQFMTPDQLSETIVRVLMPAGLEPLDPNIFGGQNYCPVPFFSFFYKSNCPTQETTPSVVSFTFPFVRSGTNSVSFRAVAATVGNFTLPPTRVFVTDQPEVMGLSSAGSFEVCQGGCEVQYINEESEPQSCPEDCNGNGSCNVKDGTCNCFIGFSGKACDIPSQ
eukprot:g4706.t1